MADESLGRSVLDLETDASRFDAGLNAAEQKAKGFTGRVKSTFADLKQNLSTGFKQGLGIGAGIGAVQAVTSAVSSAVGYMGDAIAAARDEEAGIAGLNASLEQHAKSWDGTTEAIERTIKAQQDQFAFSDGDQREALSRLVALTGGDVPKSMDLMRDAMDLARFRGIDLASAGDIIGKVYGGNIGILSRYGIQVEEGATSTEALAKVQELAAGQAEAYGESSAGAAESAGLAFADLQEDIGKKLLPVLTELSKFLRDVVVPGLTWLLDNVLGPLGKGISNVADAFRDAAGDVNYFAMNFGDQGDRVHDIADRFGGDFDDLKDRIRDRMREAGESFEEAADHIEGEMANASVEVRREAGEMMIGVGDAISSGIETQVKPEFERLAAEGVSIMSAKAQAFRDAAFQNLVSYAKGLIDGRDQPRVQMEALTQLQAEEWDRGSEIARLKGQLTSTELANGMASENPYVRAQALATRQAIIDQLAFLGEDASLWGEGIAQSLASGLSRGYGVVVNAAGELGAAVRGQIGIESEPKAHDSPLRGITKWGGNIVRTMADGVLGALRTGEQAASSLASVLVPSLGSMRMPAMATAAMASGAAGSVTQITQQWILNVNGVPESIGSKQQAVERLERVATTWG